MIPENNIGFAPVEANATPKHKGSATKKTTKLEGRSFRQWLKKFFMYKILIFPYFGET
jgi:hypothetical protein